MKRATLYDLNEELRTAIENLVDMDTGEISEEGDLALEAIGLARAEKVEAYAVVIRELEGESEMYDKEMKRMRGRRDQVRRKVRGLESRLLQNLERGEEVKGRVFRVISFPTTQVQIGAEIESEEGIKTHVPLHCQKKTDPVPAYLTVDKAACKKWLKAHPEESIVGVELAETATLQIK